MYSTLKSAILFKVSSKKNRPVIVCVHRPVRSFAFVPTIAKAAQRIVLIFKTKYHVSRQF